MARETRLEEVFKGPEGLKTALAVLELLGFDVRHQYVGNDRYAVKVREKGQNWRGLNLIDLDLALFILHTAPDLFDLPRRERRAALRELRRTV